MKFSVIMSIYYKDDEKAVLEAIDSITVKQTVKPSQIVLVKDGPIGEKLEKIIEDCILRNRKIEFKILSLEKNMGLANALNEGLKKCKYDWVARMDADDISCEDRFEKQIDYIEKHPNISVLGGIIEEFFQSPGDCSQVRIVPYTHDEIKKFSKTRNPINHMTVMYRKSAVLSVGGYSLDCGKLEDYRLWIDLLISGKVFANLRETILYARIGREFIERRSDKQEINDWDKLQNHMYKKRYINYARSCVNKLYIRVFICMPPFIKEIAYKILLRSN